MDAALAVLPQAGIAGVLVVVIALLLRANHADRAQYHQLKTSKDEQAAEEIKRSREEIKKLRDELETERHRRHEAEDELYRLRRRLGVTDHD